MDVHHAARTWVRPLVPSARAWPQQRGDRGGLPPPPPPPRSPPRPPRAADGPAEGRGCRSVVVRARGVAEEEAAGEEDDGRAGVAEREVVAAADAAGRSAALPREETGARDAGSKRWLGSTAYPPPKRRAVSANRRFPPGCGRDAAAPLAADADGSGYGDSSRTLDKAAPPPSLAGDVGSKRWSAPPAHPPSKPRAVSAIRRFPPGCGRISLSLLASGSAGETRLLVEAQPTDGGSSAAAAHAMEIVVPRTSNGTVKGPRQHEELEEGEIDTRPRVHPVVLESRGSQVSINITLHEPADGRHGATEAVEASVKHSSSQETAGSKSHCGEKTLSVSGVVAKDVKVMDKPSGSSRDADAESLAAEGPPREDRRDKRVSEIAKMGRASSDVAARVSGEGAMMRSKVMFTARKEVKPAKMIQKPAVDTQRKPVSRDKGKGIEPVRHMPTNEIEDTDDLTKEQVMRALMSEYKCLWTQGKEDATSKGYFGPRKRGKGNLPGHLLMKVGPACTLGRKEKLEDNVASNLEDEEGKLEQHLNSSSRVPSASCQGQYGVRNSDARSKVRMTCKRFEFICRTVEQQSLKIKRIDLAADKVIRKLPGFTKHGPIVGNVPGVEVGDQFPYRVLLAIVGLHRPYQGGIDTTKDGNDMPIAISIVASGGYPDKLSRSGELIYTGSGGKVAGKKDAEDQKLEGGNRGLWNCIKTKTPVRVIYGFKGSEEGSHSRAKQISTFTYDGLYHVVDCTREGRPGSKVFKFKLQRVPRQPELPHHRKTGMH